MKSINDTKGSLYAITSGFFYGFIGYFGVSIIQSNFSISNMLFWRFFVSSIMMVALLIANTKNIKANWKEIAKALVVGALFYGGSAATYFMACDYIGTGLSMVIVFTYPVVVTLSNWFFDNHKITKIYYISITIIMIGMVMLIDRTEMAFDIYGVVLAILSSLTYAMYMIASKKQMQELDPITSSFMASLSNCIMFFIIAIFTDSLVIPVGINLWINILGIGIICTALPILFLLEGMKYISSGKAALLSVLEPVCVVIVGVVLLKEHLSILQVAGIITILSGALIVQFDKIRR